jgi:XapX domain-containing protein
MTVIVVGIVLGLAIGAGCRLYDIPLPAPVRFIGACVLMMMTLGFVVADHCIATGETMTRVDTP